MREGEISHSEEELNAVEENEKKENRQKAVDNLIDSIISEEDYEQSQNPREFTKRFLDRYEKSAEAANELGASSEKIDFLLKTPLTWIEKKYLFVNNGFGDLDRFDESEKEEKEKNKEEESRVLEIIKKLTKSGASGEMLDNTINVLLKSFRYKEAKEIAESRGEEITSEKIEEIIKERNETLETMDLKNREIAEMKEEEK